MQPGPCNAITDVPGVLVGQYERATAGWATGTTVVVLPESSTGAVDGRGGAPGTRETDLLVPENLVQRVDAICLSGGSAYGLAAADGVMRWLAERNRGFPVGAAAHEVVPIVPAAVLFDLPRGTWGNRPDAEFGYLACASAAGGKVVQGCVGAGTGARVGSLKGGVGTASLMTGGHTVGALAAVNAAGEAVNPDTGTPWAADLEVAGEFGVSWPGHAADRSAASGTTRPPLNTTIGVVATDAELSKAECRRLAVAAQDGLARAVRPSHSMFDGDTVFAVATGARQLAGGSGDAAAPEDPADRADRAGPVAQLGPAARAVALDRLCAAAADTFARAMVHGVLAATGLAGLPAYHEVWPS